MVIHAQLVSSDELNLQDLICKKYKKNFKNGAGRECSWPGIHACVCVHVHICIYVIVKQVCKCLLGLLQMSEQTISHWTLFIPWQWSVSAINLMIYHMLS